eukprot:jgi/Psemu1/32804/gm1.32804_g
MIKITLKRLFGKKHISNPDEKSAAETTLDESQMKEDEGDSISQKFDLYFASSFLPHTNVAKKDVTTRGSKRKSVHWKAFMDAKEMLVPPLPPHNARARSETSPSHYPVENENDYRILPTNLIDAFQSEVEVSVTMLTNEFTEWTTASATDSASNSEENKYTALKTAMGIFTFGNALIDTVDESQSDFNQMLSRMSSETKSMPLTNPFSDETMTSSWLISEMNGAAEVEGTSADGEATVPKTIDDAINYLSNLKVTADETPDTSRSSDDTYGSTSASVYLKYVTSKMGSIAKALSEAAEEATEKTSEHCQTQVISLLECTDTTNNGAVNDSVETSYSPLDRSWFSVNKDSDSVSKLSLSTEENELSLSMISVTHEEMCF